MNIEIKEFDELLTTVYKSLRYMESAVREFHNYELNRKYQIDLLKKAIQNLTSEIKSLQKKKRRIHP